MRPEGALLTPGYTRLPLRRWPCPWGYEFDLIPSDLTFDTVVQTVSPGHHKFSGGVTSRILAVMLVRAREIMITLTLDHTCDGV